MTSSTPPFWPQDSLHKRFLALEAILLELQPLWQAQPFKQPRPQWCQDYPALTEALLCLSDTELAQLRSDDAQLYRWLSDFVPHFSSFTSLLQLEEFSSDDKENWKHLDWAVPGRKWQQITAFSAVLGDISRPLIEWCGGKGHLGRILASKAPVSVTTLERDQGLCESGQQLSQRAKVKQIFQQVDVFSSQVPNLQQHHVVALHACGELHRHLVRKAVQEQSPAIDIAPCCYHLYGEQGYGAFTKASRLTLSRDDLRLAVTETVTSKAREVRLRDREMVWKLGFLGWYAELSGDSRYRSIPSIDKQWLNGSFETFCRHLAKRQGLESLLSMDVDWHSYEVYGEKRQAEVMRLSVLRHAMRRVLELWLVLDMALYLQQHGYQVRLGTFCESRLSPRNILLSARL
ncbi:MAG: SAM-dependent methyltransferase [Gammaproteobacteria bacterium]|nr:SAM-dependent methyltransferase [Gammaproteobacteria bacterium]